MTVERVLNSFLERYRGDIDAAYQQYMADRTAIASGQGLPPAPQPASGASPQSHEDEDEDISDQPDDEAAGDEADGDDTAADETAAAETADKSAADKTDSEGNNGEGDEDAEAPANQVQPQRDTMQLLTETDIPFNNNLEQERRDAAFVLREHVRESSQYTETPSRTECILWLSRHEWDIAQAMEQFANVNHVRRRLARTFDQMRTPLQRDIVHIKQNGGRKGKQKKTTSKKEKKDEEEKDEEEKADDEDEDKAEEKKADDEDDDDDEEKKAQKQAEERAKEEARRIQMSQDERLAEFINITGRPDWYSLLLFLQQHNWDLVRAVEAWYRTGVPPYTGRPMRYTTRLAPEAGMRLGPDGEPLPKPTPADCTPSNMEAADDDQWRDEDDSFDPAEEGESEMDETPPPPPQSDRDAQSSRAPGFPINNLTKYAYKGMPNPRRFVFEYIQRGSYNANLFTKPRQFYWPERGDKKPDAGSKRVLFDWNIGPHITALTNWYRQNITRVSGEIRRAHSQPWSQAERDFLYRLQEAHFQKAKQQDPNKPDADILKGLTVDSKTKEEWEKKFNEKFAGTEQPDGIRKEREASALMTMRSRILAIVEDFKVPGDSKYFDRVRARRIRGRITRREPRQEQNDPYGGYEFHDDRLDEEGYLRTSSFIETVESEETYNLSITNMNRWFWGRALAVATEYYTTRQTFDDQVVLMEFLSWIGLPDLDVENMTEEEVLSEIRTVRDTYPLAVDGVDVAMEDAAFPAGTPSRPREGDDDDDEPHAGSRGHQRPSKRPRLE